MIHDTDPTTYVGEVISRKKKGETIYIRSGHGKQKWSDDSIYLGRFKDDNMNGIREKMFIGSHRTWL